MIENAKGRPPFRADHIGSLLRPAMLRQAFRDHAAQRIDSKRFAQIQDRCIQDAVTMQEHAGLKVVTDGEFRRGSYWGRFVERADGFVIKPAVFKFRDDQGHELDFTAPYAAGTLRRNRALAVDEFQFLRGITKHTPKITLPAPSTMHFFRCTDFADAGAYPTVDAYFADLGAIFRDEITDLANAGCRYIQLDEVAIAQLCDSEIRRRVEAMGARPDGLVDLYIESLNDIMTAAPPDVAIGLHICRGNLKGHYLAAGGYESVSERLFGRLAANHFLLEYDTERSGDFKPLRFVKDKGVVLGLISSKTPILESLDSLVRRIEEASQYVDLERLAISPQCGFASTAAGNPLTEAEERAKLDRVVEVARHVWH